jgi:hypothetical protein
VDDQVLPPYADPTGPRNTDEAVVQAFARGLYAGHSPRFHVEGIALLVDRMATGALRVGPNTILVRADLPPDLESARTEVERVLTGEGLCCLDEDTLLAAPVAIQVTGMRMSSWDLWGNDIDEAFARLRAAAMGDESKPALDNPPPPTPPPDPLL